MVKLELCWELDIPTHMEQALKDAFPPSTLMERSITRINVHELMELLPNCRPWLARNGYVGENYTMLITRTKDAVDQPVEK